MILGIDASNIRSGGGLTHLLEILEHGNPSHNGIEKVIVWSNNTTLSKLPHKQWLMKETHILLNKSFIFSFIFQLFFISKFARDKNVDVLFVPGGTFLGSFENIVSMSQNMLPFENLERARFKNWHSVIRFRILEITQSYTFRRSKGVIFLTKYAQKLVQKKLSLVNMTTIISHGINLNFLQEPKKQKNIFEYSNDNLYKLLYVSIITAYKHQWNVAEAVIQLREKGYNISLDLVGDHTIESLNVLNNVLKKDIYKCINYKGLIRYQDLEKIYKDADAFIFASSCENQPIILLEAMTAGLPIACSNMGPMPEVLGDNGQYFNPLDTKSIFENLKQFLENEKQREINSEKSFEKSLHYTWENCSDLTFQFLSSFKLYT